MSSKLTKQQKEITKNISRVFIGRSYTNDYVNDLIAPLTTTEIELIKNAVIFLKGSNNSSLRVDFILSNPHTSNAIGNVLYSDQMDSYDNDDYEPMEVPFNQFIKGYKHTKLVNETSRLTIFIDSQGDINLDLEIGSNDPDTAMSAIVFRGKSF